MSAKKKRNVSKQSRSWVFTLKAHDNDGVFIEQSDIEKAFKKYTYVCQLEKGEGENGYLHYQGYIENSGPISFETLKNKFSAIHLEPRRGSKSQAFDYCVKEETRVNGHLPFGNMDKPVKEAKPTRGEVIKSLREKLLVENIPLEDILLEDASAANHYRYLEKLDSVVRAERASKKLRTDLKVTYLYGDSGVGKTRSIYEKYDFKDIYVVSDYNHPFDSYTGQKVLVLDEFAGQLSFESMLKIMDIYPCQLPARYNNKWAEYDEVYVISNLPLGSLYSSERANPKRWKALTRRVHEHVEMLPGGVVEAREKPKPVV